MRDKIIRIHWNKALPLEEAISSDLAKTQGLYYLTRMFGEKERSLYIGIATNNNTISRRLKAHRAHWLNLYRGKIFVRIGTVVYPREVNHHIIDHAESAIVFEMSDVFFENTMKTRSYSYTDLYRVENEGDIFELKPKIRMHEHEEVEEYFRERTLSYKNEPNALINRWLNDPSPCSISQNKPTPESLDLIKIKINQIPEEEREEYLKKRVDC